MNVTARTLRCFVQGPNGGLIRSTNHALAAEDRAGDGDPIVQPGRYDGGDAPADVVATLDEVVPLVARGNRMDAATAALVDGVEYDGGVVPGLGRLAGVTEI